MKSTFKKLPGSKIALEVTLDSKEFLEYWQTTYEAAAAEAEIKGFRKGAAPKELVDKVLDKEKIFNEAARIAIKRTLDEVANQNEWKIIDSPKIEITEASPEGEKGLSYKADLVIFPEVKLGNYRKIAADISSEKKEIKVATEEVEKSFEWLRKSRAKIVRAEHPARKGDVVNVDVETLIEGSAKPSKAKGDQFVLGESHWLPGFDTEIEGHKSGDQFEFSLAAPQGGKKVNFKVTLNGVFDQSLPELNDEFAKGLGEQFQTLEDVRKNVVEGLTYEKEQKEKERRQIKMLQEISEASKIDLPEIMVEKQLGHLVQEFTSYAPETGKSPEELRSSLRERAVQGVRNNLIIYQIVKDESLEPQPEEVLEEIKRQNLDREKYYDYIYSALQNKKVFEFLESSRQ